GGLFRSAAGVAPPQGQPPTPAEIAAKAEDPSAAAYRYRTAIAGLLNLQPGMTAAELGPGSGFVARARAPLVGAGGRVIAASTDREMADYNVGRAKSEGIVNLSTLVV